jgi:hypothetical protein
MKQEKHYLRFPSDCHAAGVKKTVQTRAIFNYFRFIFLIFLAPAAAPIAAMATEAPQTQPVAQRIDQLIDQLSSDDATERQSAAGDLLTIGLPARPAVLVASRTDEPGLRDQAAQILLQLPWYLPNDPKPVRDLLKHYGVPDVSQRRQIIESLVELNDPAALDVLGRLLNEDPSVGVRWTIVGFLRRLNNDTLLARYRTVEPPQDDPPMLALCAYARLDANPAQARQFLNRCADLEFSAPSDDGEFDNVIQVLCDFAVQDKAYAAAADLRRKQYARGSPDDGEGIPSALLELFALQAEYGPLPGLQGDLQLAGSAAGQPKIEYCLTRLYTRAGKADQAATARAAAFAGSHTRTQRLDIGEFLTAHEWDDLAQAEFTALLTMPPDPDDPSRQLDVLAHFHLATLAIKRGDELAAAKNEETALRSCGEILPVVRIDALGHQFPIAASEIWPEVHWHYLHVAQANHDDAQIREQLKQISLLRPTDPDIVIEVYRLLIHRGQPDAAKTLFDSAFNSGKAKLDGDPHNPDLLNSQAWLCAECDQHLPQALVWSEESVSVLPRDSAAIDTLADVNFRLGDAKKAAELEAEALKYEPGDSFMTGQLAKYLAAATQASTRPN